MSKSPGIVYLVLLAIVGSCRARYIFGDRRLFDEGDFYGMAPAPQQALQPAESPSFPLSSLHLTGSLPQDEADMHVRDWDPEIKSFLVRSKQPGLGCHQLGAKQPLQQRTPEGNPIASNYFFRGGSSIAGVGSGQGEATSGGQGGDSLQGGQADGSQPCADLPINIFAALSRDGYVRHTALTGDQPEFR